MFNIIILMRERIFSKSHLFATVLTFAIIATAGAAPGQKVTPWAETANSAVHLISAAQAVGENAQVKLGLHFRMKEGWKVYWRSPGEAGYPPKLDWSGSKNIKRVSMDWPAPKRFQVLGLNTLGYQDEVVFPLTVDLTRAGTNLHAKVKVDYLTCKEICLPVSENLDFTLPSGPAIPSSEAHLINRFAVQVPVEGGSIGLDLKSVTVHGPMQSNPDQAVLRVAIKSPTQFEKPDLFVEGPEGIIFAEPIVQFDTTNKTTILDVPVSGLKFTKASLTGANLVLTLVGSPLSAEFRSIPIKGQGVVPENIAKALKGDRGETSIWLMIGLALFGGLILNLMPCVLPVLSIKLMSVVKHGGGDPAHVRSGFVATSAGILVSFLLLAGGLIVLKTSGAVVGWGIQFQSPWFLIAMTILVTLFACNLWGLFEIHLPMGWIMDTGTALPGNRKGLLNNFLTGAFAMLLATPCSAPFLGTAVGFALARGPQEIVLIFSALGVGLASPYLGVAAFPRLVTMLPRPGRWMITLRRILGIALAGTGIWLVSVLAVEIGWAAATLSGGIVATIPGVFFLLSRRVSKPIGATAFVVVISLLAFSGPFIFPQTTSQASSNIPEGTLEGIWRPFDEKAIPNLVVQGKTVFVDVTAEWCITCKVNKRFVLSYPSVFQKLSATNVIAMQADWTLPDERISTYLARFDRFGIPFNVVYGPGTPRGKMLPELLTPALVLDALGKAEIVTSQQGEESSSTKAHLGKSATNIF